MSKQHKKLLLIILLAGAGVFGIGFTALADTAVEIGAGAMKLVVLAVGTVLQWSVMAIGQITVVLVHLLIKVAQYNKIVDSEAVTQGWVILRDVVNMFFIVILLVIAFGTIFNIQQYTYKAMLPRLLIMAVVINFSRTIAGILIDFGQIVMLTFVNGFQAAAGGNFVNALRMNELLDLNDKSGLDIANAGTLLVGLILAWIAMIIMLVVVAIMLAVLIMRIVMLQFLVVLSPLAFLASVWPSGRIRDKYGKWWDMFLDNIIIGPLLAFFLWLSLLVLGSGGIAEDFGVTATDYGGEAAAPTIGPTKFGSPESMMSYVFGIGMLLCSLYMAQSLRSVGAGLAGSALGKIKQYSRAAIKKPAAWAGKKAWDRTKYTARGAAISGLSAVSKTNIPFASSFARKRVGSLRQKQEVASTKYGGYLKGLSREEREKEAQYLERSVQTTKVQGMRRQLERGRMYELAMMKPEDRAEAMKRITFLESQAAFDPTIGKELAEIKRRRLDYSFDPNNPDDLAKRTQGMDTSEARVVSDLAFKNNPDFCKVFFENLADTVLRDLAMTGSKIQQGAALDHLRGDPTKLGAMASGLDNRSAVRFSADYFRQGAFAGNLDDSVLRYVESRGSRDQKAAIAAYRARRGGPGAGGPGAGGGTPAGGALAPSVPPGISPETGAREIEMEEGGEDLELETEPTGMGPAGRRASPRMGRLKRRRGGRGMPPAGGAPMPPVPPTSPPPPAPPPTSPPGGPPPAPPAPPAPPPAPFAPPTPEIDSAWVDTLEEAEVGLREDRIAALQRRSDEIDKIIDTAPKDEQERLGEEFNALNREIYDLKRAGMSQQEIEQKEGERQRFREVRWKLDEEYSEKKVHLEDEWRRLNEEMKRLPIGSEEWEKVKARRTSITEIDEEELEKWYSKEVGKLFEGK